MGNVILPEILEIGEGAVERLVAFCKGRDPALVHIVSDENTRKAIGTRAEDDLRKAGFSIRTTVFPGSALAADAASVYKVLVEDERDERGERLYIAAGSGTITDIVRFVCHRTGRDFVSLPTAPSVDAYTSIVAPMMIEGVKVSVATKAPVAVFADLKVLVNAPKDMVSAGFGDIICKFSAVADWRLGALLWNEPFDESLALRSRECAQACAAAAEEIGKVSREGVKILMNSLFESGLCMALAGHSRPASGTEHQYSHFWEVRLLREGRPSILHGAKVGIGSLIAAGLWDFVRGLSKTEAERLLTASKLPDRERELAAIREAFGSDADEMIATQTRFLGMDTAQFEALKGSILRNWDRILAFAESVPGRAETEKLLKSAGAPTDPKAIGLKDEEIQQALSAAHYSRDRFTVRKLYKILTGE